RRCLAAGSMHRSRPEKRSGRRSARPCNPAGRNDPARTGRSRRRGSEGPRMLPRPWLQPNGYEVVFGRVVIALLDRINRAGFGNPPVVDLADRAQLRHRLSEGFADLKSDARGEPLAEHAVHLADISYVSDEPQHDRTGL